MIVRIETNSIPPEPPRSERSFPADQICAMGSMMTWIKMSMTAVWLQLNTLLGRLTCLHAQLYKTAA